jgi:hypothetical protein
VFVPRNTEELAFFFGFELIAISFAAGEDEALACVGLVVVPIARKGPTALAFFFFFLADFWKERGGI